MSKLICNFFALGEYVPWISVKSFPCVLLWQKDFAFQNRGICSCYSTQNWCLRICFPCSSANAYPAFLIRIMLVVSVTTWRSRSGAADFWQQPPKFGCMSKTALQLIENLSMMYWSKVSIFDFTTLYDLSLFREKAHCSAYCVHRLEKRGTMKWLCPAVKYFTDFTMTCLEFVF